ncbi:hypothetical protein SKAU_G00368450 [Synaphobranchus kaupii]|uniref:Uncharacterized protein n=1 Tax=Synaphobranchus kaupii TaxID=118154 RepID=A0A9Q1EFJ6_SYNKA|nr:hypothetical protein SKAU_G00368450 [Synaphobranchus kaupii]
MLTGVEVGGFHDKERGDLRGCVRESGDPGTRQRTVAKAMLDVPRNGAGYRSTAGELLGHRLLASISRQSNSFQIPPNSPDRLNVYRYRPAEFPDDLEASSIWTPSGSLTDEQRA